MRLDLLLPKRPATNHSGKSMTRLLRAPIRRYLLALLFLAGALSCANSSRAQHRVLEDRPFEIMGVRIAKSGSVQLADLSTNSYDLLEQSTYIPAGTTLLLLKQTKKDRKGRGLNLSVTSTGLLVYVRVDGTHYISADDIERRMGENRAVAIAQSKFEVTTRHYGVITITPTEIYAFKYAPGDKIEIRVGREKMGDQWSEDEEVMVNVDDFAIVDADQLRSDAIAEPFQAYDAIKDLKSILETAESLSSEERNKFVRVLQNGRLVHDKACNDEIEIKAEADAGVAFDTDSVFSPLKAKLGLSGKYSQTTKFLSGTELMVRRYARAGEVVEFKQEQIYKDGDCRKPLERQRLTIAQHNDKSAEIDSANPAGLQLTSTFLPQYSCRDEYMKLLDYYVLQENLSYDAAVLAIAYFSRYRNPQNASACAN
ncbi:hypothetical protein N181_29630 [Sinorhizobium fredii USDA 205]|nr:hypothetical protein N181_29630 [Sinorhizobium fredii USDA 205]